jgi:HAD superfamily hydrolase (TIGR01549 family)
MEYDAIVFDNDGVLVELTDLDVVRRAIEETFHEFGVEAPTEAEIERLIGPDLETVKDLAETYGFDAAAFWYRRDHNVAAAQCAEIDRGNKRPYPDVEALRSIDRPLGIVSNNQQVTVDFLVVRFFDGQFQTVTGREPTLEGIRRKKPSPYYLRRAIDALEADEVLFVGDSNVDLAAADAAGVDAAFLSRPHRDGYDLRYEPAYELDSLEDLHELASAR